MMMAYRFLLKWLHWSSLCKVAVNNVMWFNLSTDPRIQNFMMILIITNSIVLGIQAGEQKN